MGISAYEEMLKMKENNSSEDEEVTFLAFLTVSTYLGMVSFTSTMVFVSTSNYSKHLSV